MKLTRIIILALTMCFLVGCSQTTVNPADQFVFTRENFPRMDGSTSTVPLGEAIASVLLGETREEVSDLIQFNKTTQSYRNLMNGEADLLIAAEPAETIWTEKAEMSFEWDMEPFAIDGLVFIVNEANPVNSLTIEQVQKIYSGEITNWAEVGGDDLEIMPFQRNAEAGSQAAMEKLVMKDIQMIYPPTEEYYYDSMTGLILGISSYDNSPAAIGYTMYYYAEDMEMAEGLKILSIDGVEPNDNTIRSGEYPFLNNYYVVTASGRDDTDPVKRLYDWILSDEGQRLAAHEGYVPVMDVGGAK